MISYVYINKKLIKSQNNIKKSRTTMNDAFFRSILLNHNHDHGISIGAFAFDLEVKSKNKQLTFKNILFLFAFSAIIWHYNHSRGPRMDLGLFRILFFYPE